jgi:hypothetical protein
MYRMVKEQLFELRTHINQHMLVAEVLCMSQQFISKGTIDVPAPLMHIIDQDVLAIFDTEG